MNLEKAIKYSGYTAAGLYVLIGFIVSFEVISRYIFNAPTIWVNEISRLLQIWATYLALTYTFHNKEFIRITVFYDKANDKTKKVLDFISFIFIIYFSSFVTYYGWLIAYDSFEVGRTSSTILDLPAVITEIAIPISFALLLIRVFLEILRYIRDFVKP
ncbi:TRAP-type C4-dicarboxylate transport system, small permease protein [alpha proteobacterium HIMB114]|nr:TRAP-type C4-dicarboxylate transport system, small permease protein [alpha proteobacterium HIMB114]